MKKKILIIIGIVLVILVGSTILLLHFRSQSGSDEPEHKECEPFTGGAYTLIFETNGGEKIDNMRICIACSPDSYEDIPTPTKENDLFEGWYYDSSFQKEMTSKSTLDIEPKQEKDSKGCMIGYKDITLYAKWKNTKTSEKEEDSKKTSSKDTKSGYYCADGSAPVNGKCTSTEIIAAGTSYTCDEWGVTPVNNKCHTGQTLPATGASCPGNSTYSVVLDACYEVTNDDADTCTAKGGYMDMGGTSCTIQYPRPTQFYCTGEAAGWTLINGSTCELVVDAKVVYKCPSGYNLNGNQCTKTTTTKALKK